MQISLLKSYYIRKLLRQHGEHLKFVVVPQTGFPIDPLSDMNSILQTLYREDTQLNAVIRELETLAGYHQDCSAKDLFGRDHLAEIEDRIFSLLGFTRSPLSESVHR